MEKDLSLHEISVAIRQIQRDITALASRPYTERAESAKSEATKVGTDLEALDEEVAESVLALAETMLDISVEIETITKGE